MSKHFVQSTVLRGAAIKAYRAYASVQIWRKGPRIFLNSLPKAGTHLLMSMLETAPGIMNARLHIERPASQTGTEIDAAALKRQLASIRGGQVATAHLPYIASIAGLIANEGFRTVNLVRSPRDMLISRYFYIVGLRRHRLHKHLVETYPDKKSRIIALIRGPQPGEDTIQGHFRPYAFPFTAFSGWLTAPCVVTLRYEDLVGTRGGGSDERQLAALSTLARHLDLSTTGEHLQSRWAAVQHRGNATFRKGQIGDWVNHFDEDIEAVFEQHLGEIDRLYNQADVAAPLQQKR